MIDFVTFDAQKELESAVERYESLTGETLYPGDEHYMFLAQLMMPLAAIAGKINETANQNLLKNSTGTVLDEYGKENDTERIAAQAASVTMKFSNSSSLGFDVTIPAGTRVTPDGLLIFVLDSDAVIPAGETSALGVATAEKAGAAYNEFLPGQINSLIDPVEYVGCVVNVTASAGGSDEENDDSYRERIRLSREAISTAGSKESYEYWAKTASADLADVKAVKTSAGVVTIYLLMENAEQPSQNIMDAVFAACTPQKRRPLTDQVLVTGAETVPYSIALTYYISKSRSTEEAGIKSAVDKAVSNFISLQKRQLGGNLNPDGLRDALYAAGAYRVDLTAPEFMALSDWQVAVTEEPPSVIYGGLL
ncbi:MAG: baseplate J/gp47 family protein [Oscillospiraceae bacterium]|jgi:phage-related baseplate assembly protein|nr:baseplate J/gp47 family protein [Oscillospiraceae bacterium]